LTRRRRARPARRSTIACLPTRVATVALLLLGGASSGCHAVRGQPIPAHGRAARRTDFDAPPDVVVLHYYGVGGWGILWKGSYLLTAPYFSNHGYLASSIGEEAPKQDAIDAGFAGTPYDETSVILVGHGHVDHASDIPAYPFAQMPLRPTLVADQSTINLLGDATRGKICAIPLVARGGAITIPTGGACPTGNFRIQALPWAHAPHAACESTGLSVTVGDAQGTQASPLAQPPSRGNDWLVGRTWAFVIELLDQGRPVFRILYADAAASQSFVDPDALVSDAPTDVHIACVPGFDYVQGYPEEVIGRHHVKYVLAGHWEDFFRSRECRLAPVAVLSDGKMDQFVGRAEAAIGPPSGNQPTHPTSCHDDCGPAGDTWTVPIPGETLWFHTAPAESAAQ
jgi:hypothetical protein